MTARAGEHTPGPWANSGADVKSGNPDEWIYGGQYRARIAKVQFGLNYGQDIAAETAANARLIAAAPDLLEALVEMERAFGAECSGGPAVRARAAIAKARGNP